MRWHLSPKLAVQRTLHSTNVILNSSDSSLDNSVTLVLPLWWMFGDRFMCTLLHDLRVDFHDGGLLVRLQNNFAMSHVVDILYYTI